MKLKLMTLLFTLFILGSLVAVSACSSSSPSSTTIIKTLPPTTVTDAFPANAVLIPTGDMPTSTVQSPDDIVFTPGGPAYRANVHQQGVPDTWPSIPGVTSNFTSGNVTLWVYYRDVIPFKAGESHTDLIEAGGGQAFMNSKLTLLMANVPDGFTVISTQNGMARPGVLDEILLITAGKSVAPGHYQFPIAVEVDGVYLCAVLCDIEVTS
jgi:hypothetical protein